MKLSSRDKSGFTVTAFENFEAPVFATEQEQLYEHETPTQILREKGPGAKPVEDKRLVRLKFLQRAHDLALEDLFKDLGQRYQKKEISDRFWNALPADIRTKHKEKIDKIRTQIRDIYQQFPEHFEQYKKENKPYFKKQEKNQPIDIRGL